jgi:2-succinyl-5-enolpyruvyl-6-hydroxy-3-cyclohexene-1-carboxylate synthase
MHSSKVSAQIIIESLKDCGVEQLVISPGSRNAPLVIECIETNYFKLHSIIDERSAGYVALGIAQQTQKPVAVICTSGSAVLNYAPSFAEAYYMKIPLIAISADRPKELIDMADGQTIKQINSLANVTKHSVALTEIEGDKDLRYFYRNLTNALCKLTQEPIGPIHINVPFSEPLYSSVEKKDELPFPKFNFNIKPNYFFNKSELPTNIFGKSKKCLLLIGQRNFNELENKIIHEFSIKNNIPILVETTSNLLNYQNAISIDSFLESLSNREREEFQPDILITYKTNIVSKKIKVWLKENLKKQHIHIGQEHQNLDTYNSHSIQINSNSNLFFEEAKCESSPEYFNTFNAKVKSVKLISLNFNSNFSDFKVFELIANSLPQKSKIVFGNSASIRYAQLFEEFYKMESFCNRGTSGIEGTLSTAVGAAYSNPTENVFCILGDTSFFYDSNALLNQQLPKNLKIIVINNNGGGIFRIIEGPSKVTSFEKYIETEHNFSAQKITSAFNVTYFSAIGIDDFLSSLHKLLVLNSIGLLEVFTPKNANDLTLKRFFKSLGV